MLVLIWLHLYVYIKEEQSQHGARCRSGLRAGTVFWPHGAAVTCYDLPYNGRCCVYGVSGILQISLSDGQYCLTLRR